MLDDSGKLSRRDAIKIGVGAGVALTLDRHHALAAVPSMFSPQNHNLTMRQIPSSGERVPIVGIGTARNYENPTPDQIPLLRDVMRQFPTRR